MPAAGADFEEEEADEGGDEEGGMGKTEIETGRFALPTVGTATVGP